MSDLFDYSFEPQSRADSALERGRVLVEVGRPIDAVAFLHQAIAADASRLEAWCLLSQAYLQASNAAEALTAARQAVTLAPDQEWPHRLQALALLAGGRPAEALREAEAAGSLAPDEPNVLYTLGRCCLGSGRTAHSRAAALRLSTLAPEWSETHELLGLIALRSRQWREAERSFREALRLAPQSWTAHNNLALALRAQRREAEAVEHFHTAARLNPRSELVLSNLQESVTDHVHGRWMLVLGVALYFALWILFQTRIIWAYHGAAELVLIGGILAGLVAIAVSRARKLRTLPTSLQRFYRERRGRKWLVVPALAIAYYVWFMACCFCCLKSIELQRFGAYRAGVTGQGLAWYLASWGVVALGLAALGLHARKELAVRGQLKT